MKVRGFTIPDYECGQRTAIACTVALMLLSVLALVLSCRTVSDRATPSPAPAISEGPPVHVLLATGRSELTLHTLYGGLWHTVGRDAREGRFGPGRLTVHASAAGIGLGEEPNAAQEVHLAPHDGLFEFDGRSYRGALKVVAGDDGLLRVFEVVHLEDYIRGVLPAEIYPHWPMDAIIAQAVAIRTFALNMVLDPRTRYWLTALDLAYRGAGHETGRTDEAVRLSAGHVLTYEGKLFPAFFHSTCGGRTASAGSVFGAHDIGPLQPVDCGWCEGSQYSEWEVSFPLSEISERVFPGRYITVEGIEIERPDGSRRAEFIVINGTERLRASEFRLAMGTMRLKSTVFEVRVEGERAHFRGGGFGHGVGLCQWGSHGMAEAGYGWRDILKHYYPGSAVTQVQDVR